MATVLEIIQGLAQAAANVYDGVHDERFTLDGQTRSLNLRREEGCPIMDSRVMDGFNVKFYGDMMCISYQSDIKLKEVYANGFEGEVDQRLTDIVSWLKKEYRKITGNSVSLTKEGEADMRVESSSRVRSWVTAKCHYRIGGMDEVVVVGEGSEDRLEANWRSFLDQGGLGKRAKNDKRPKPKND